MESEHISIKDKYNGKKIVLVGPNRSGKRSQEVLKLNGIDIDYFYDINEKKAGTEFNGKKVISLEELKHIVSNAIVILTIMYERKIDDFKKMGFKAEMYEDVEAKIYAEKMQGLKNSHLGEKCFIIGNGSSLLAEDLENIRDFYSFGTNKIYDIYNRTNWRPNIYIIQDEAAIKNMGEDFPSVETDIRIISHDVRYRCHYYTDDSIVFQKNNDAYPFYEPKFSNDCSRFIYDGYTVTYTAMQLAAYMGFKEIYLLGVDMRYSCVKGRYTSIIKDNSQDYFQGMTPNKEWTVPDIDYNLKAYRVAKRYCNENNIKIYNATRGGSLEVFERVDFDNIIK